MPQQVIIVHVQLPDNPLDQMKRQVQELQSLVETAGGEVVCTLMQARPQIDGRTVIGKGKLKALKDLVGSLEADLVVFYQELTHTQNRNLQEALEVGVIDRVQLILDIFAQRAQSKEGKLQVALAQSQYLLPRLAGQGKSLSRLGGGIGSRGPGETQLEQDRRFLRKKIQKIKQDLKQVEKHRQVARKNRTSSFVFRVGLMGYTNAGKSTLLTGLTSADTYQADQLFATLTPLTRHFQFPNQCLVSVTDTVGFIQDLPPLVIDAFHSTLEESRQVDLLLIVVDSSSPYAKEQEEVVNQLLIDLHMQEIPRLYLYNKTDCLPISQEVPLTYSRPFLKLSAKSKSDIERLKEAIADQIKRAYTPFSGWVAPEELSSWLKCRSSLYLESVHFDQGHNAYRLKGYRPPTFQLPRDF